MAFSHKLHRLLDRFGVTKWLRRATEWVKRVIQIVPERIRVAFVKTATGFLLGCMTAVVLVWSSTEAFPELGEFGQDLGLRANEHVERLKSVLSGRPFGDEVDRQAYVFLDVDPERGAEAPSTNPESLPSQSASPSELACAALVNADRKKVRMVKGMNCSPSRPLNRYLLAELVKELVTRGAKLIVLDVVLARETGVIADAENEVLVKVLTDRSESDRKVPILLVEPVEVARPTGDAQDGIVRREAPTIIEAAPDKGICSGVAVPAPGFPVRRYFKRLLVIDGEARYVPSLPFLAAETITNNSCRMKATSDFDADAGATRAPRIIYTLPPLEGHQDDAGSSTSRELWALYRGVYNRCLAARFWDQKTSADRSECSLPAMYKDKVVVIGASNPARRDRHYTPLGDMAGSEVVINATRSFLLYKVQDKSLSHLIWEELKVVWWCAFIWLGYYYLRSFFWPKGKNDKVSFARRVCQIALLPLIFLVALLAVGGLAIYLSWHPKDRVPSVDIFIPVLAIAIDTYVERVVCTLHRTEGLLRFLLMLPKAEDHH